MFRRAFPIVVLGLLVAGCESGAPLLSRQTTLGTLKTSVSQLEYRNEQLQKQVAELKSENRHFEDRLVQEQTENDDLATRLDNLKGQVGQRDGAENIRTGSRTPTEDNSVDDLPPPKSRRSSGRRKPPAASIPGRIEPARESDDVGLSDDPPPRRRVASDRPTREDRWLPVARGIGTREGELR